MSVTLDTPVRRPSHPHESWMVANRFGLRIEATADCKTFSATNFRDIYGTGHSAETAVARALATKYGITIRHEWAEPPVSPYGRCDGTRRRSRRERWHASHPDVPTPIIIEPTAEKATVLAAVATMLDLVLAAWDAGA